ncbi:Uncharacterised protein [Mycobacteroides abscessus subsp. abscessus]|nr:Uncharacterised protein [Mycobacteroides abscessus subsp. abscessus]
MPTRADLLGESAGTALGDPDSTLGQIVDNRFGGRRGGRCVLARPCGEDVCRVLGIGSIAEKMVGAVESDERLRMTGKVEDDSRVVHRHDLVCWGMHDEQRGVEGGNALALRLHRDVVEELATHAKRSPPDRHRGLTRFDDGRHVAEHSDDMEGVGRGADGDDTANLGNLRRGGQDGRPAQRMPNQYRRGTELITEIVCSADQVLDVGTEAGRGEVAVGLPQAGEVEPQYRDTTTRQRTRDPACSRVVLATCEAVREQSPRCRGVTRHLQLADQLSATAAEDRSGWGAHTPSWAHDDLR